MPCLLCLSRAYSNAILISELQLYQIDSLFNPVGWDTALHLLPITVSHLFLQKQQHCIPPKAPFTHYVQLLWETVWSGHRRVTRCHLVQEGGEHTACLGRTRPKHNFFRESRFWFFEGSWERKHRSLGVQTHPSYFSRPSKLTAARYAATSSRCPVCLLAKYLCALAVLQLIRSIEAK